MASSRNMLLNQEVAAVGVVSASGMAAEAYGRFERYVQSSSGHTFAHFQQAGSAPNEVPDMGMLVPGFGITSPTFVMPERALAPADYGAPAVPAEIRRRASDRNDRNVKPYRGQWTQEEDDLLRSLVEQRGEHKWSGIADKLPGRTGKQCRERWTNNLRPDIKKEYIWTEEDDAQLIDAHVKLGNKWSEIARCLPGRSENAVKNRWNATKRSLKSKRRFKKKTSHQAPAGQFTALEEYIRDIMTAEENEEPPAGPGYDGQLVPNAVAAMLATTSPAGGMGVYLHPAANGAGSSSEGAMMNLSSPLPYYSSYYYPSSSFLPAAATTNNNLLHYAPLQAFPQMFGAQGRMHAACPNPNLLPLPEHVGGSYYYNGGMGRSISDPDEDVVQMATREFQTSDNDEATLDLIGLNN